MTKKSAAPPLDEECLRRLAEENAAEIDRAIEDMKRRPGEFERFKAELQAHIEEGERDIRAGRVVTAEEHRAEMDRFMKELARRPRKRPAAE